MDIVKFFKFFFFSFYVHPVEKIPGSRSARRAEVFYSARAVGEIKPPKGEIPNYKSQITNKGASFGRILNAFGKATLIFS